MSAAQDTIKDLGKKGGLEHWRWSDIIFKIIKMQAISPRSRPSLPAMLSRAASRCGHSAQLSLSLRTTPLLAKRHTPPAAIKGRFPPHGRHFSLASRLTPATVRP